MKSVASAVAEGLVHPSGRSLAKDAAESKEKLCERVSDLEDRVNARESREAGARAALKRLGLVRFAECGRLLLEQKSFLLKTKKV